MSTAPIALNRGLTDAEIEERNPAGAPFFVDGEGQEECSGCGVFGAECLPDCLTLNGRRYAPVPSGLLNGRAVDVLGLCEYEYPRDVIFEEA